MINSNPWRGGGGATVSRAFRNPRDGRAPAAQTTHVEHHQMGSATPFLSTTPKLSCLLGPPPLASGRRQ